MSDEIQMYRRQPWHKIQAKGIPATHTAEVVCRRNGKEERKGERGAKARGRMGARSESEINKSSAELAQIELGNYESHTESLAQPHLKSLSESRSFVRLSAEMHASRSAAAST
eukprot:6196865-Pleurochrysis_carterae.AAC.2